MVGALMCPKAKRRPGCWNANVVTAMGVIARCCSKQEKTERKQFFFEKKNQKTFDHYRTRQERLTRTATSKSLLVLFFRKELLPTSFALRAFGP